MIANVKKTGKQGRNAMHSRLGKHTVARFDIECNLCCCWHIDTCLYYGSSQG